MKKYLTAIIFALVLGVAVVPYTAFTYYPCELVDPSEIGDCSPCSATSQVNCQRDCITIEWSTACDHFKKPIFDCQANTFYGSPTPHDAGCTCPTNTVINYSHPLSGVGGGFSCTSACQTNMIYPFQFGASRCMCPVNTVMDSVGTNSFRCITYPVTPAPSPLPSPITYCDIGRAYTSTGYQKQCVCPHDSYKVTNQEAYGSYSGENNFTCIPTYTPVPYPTPTVPLIYCPDGSMTHDASMCTPYHYCVTDGHPAYTCYLQEPQQTCSDGTTIPISSSCPSKKTCSQNQYWNGYTCITLYQYPDPVWGTPQTPLYAQPSVNKNYENQYNYSSSYGWSRVRYSN